MKHYPTATTLMLTLAIVSLSGQELSAALKICDKQQEIEGINLLNDDLTYIHEFLTSLKDGDYLILPEEVQQINNDLQHIQNNIHLLSPLDDQDRLSEQVAILQDKLHRVQDLKNAPLIKRAQSIEGQLNKENRELDKKTKEIHQKDTEKLLRLSQRLSAQAKSLIKPSTKKPAAQQPAKSIREQRSIQKNLLKQQLREKEEGKQEEPQQPSSNKSTRPMLSIHNNTNAKMLIGYVYQFSGLNSVEVDAEKDINIPIIQPIYNGKIVRLFYTARSSWKNPKPTAYAVKEDIPNSSCILEITGSTTSLQYKYKLTPQEPNEQN